MSRSFKKKLYPYLSHLYFKTSETNSDAKMCEFGESLINSLINSLLIFKMSGISIILNFTVALFFIFWWGIIYKYCYLLGIISSKAYDLDFWKYSQIFGYSPNALNILPSKKLYSQGILSFKNNGNNSLFNMNYLRTMFPTKKGK